MKASSEMPKTHNLMRLNDEFRKVEDKMYSDWAKSLQPCEIKDSELDKIIENRLNLLSTCQETYIEDNLIEVTDIVEEYLFYADENKPPYSVRFKSPAKFEANPETDSIDRLVGWFRKRVSIKEHEVDYLKFVMREYNSFNKK